MLTAAGMVAVVDSVVIAAFAGLVPEATGVHWPAIPLTCGAAVGAGVFALHERHHRRAPNTYRPEAVDRAAIFIPPSQKPTRHEERVHYVADLPVVIEIMARQ